MRGVVLMHRAPKDEAPAAEKATEEAEPAVESKGKGKAKLTEEEQKALEEEADPEDDDDDEDDDDLDLGNFGRGQRRRTKPVNYADVGGHAMGRSAG